MLITPLFTQNCQLNNERPGTQYEGYIHVISTYSPNTDSEETKEFLPEQRLILYKNYLVEAAAVYNVVDWNQSDTSGYYFIDLEKQVFSKYDALSEDAKELEHGKLAAKPLGLSFFTRDKDLFDNASDLRITDTVVNNEHIKMATAFKKDSLSYRLKAWVRPGPVDFPAQLSKFLSTKAANGFVDKLQYSINNEKTALICHLQYKAGKLPASIIRLIEKWSAQPASR